jgi:predicted secreted protein
LEPTIKCDPPAKAGGKSMKSSDKMFTPQNVTVSVKELASRLARIESVLCDLHELVTNRQTVKDSYTTQEVAKILDKKPYTVREWCRLQRVHAFKAMCGRGCEEEWRITHEELLRIQNEGLLPPPEHY